MRRNLEPIEIQEPPIQELKKKRSCLKRTCATGCGCIVIFIIAAILLLKFVTGPRPKELKTLPTNFPAVIPLYDQKEINKITFISGKDRSRGLEIVAYTPKLILSPILLFLDKNSNFNQNKSENESTGPTKKTGWSEWLRLMQELVIDHRDSYQLEWEALLAEPRFIVNYFQNELKKNNFIVEKITDTDSAKKIRFVSTTIEIDGELYLEDNNQSKGTDYLLMTVNAPDGYNH